MLAYSFGVVPAVEVLARYRRADGPDLHLVTAGGPLLIVGARQPRVEEAVAELIANPKVVTWLDFYSNHDWFGGRSPVPEGVPKYASVRLDLGVPLGVGSTTRFVRLVGPARAKEIIMECRRYTADEACALGLLHRVVGGDALGKATRALAERLAAKPARPLAEVKARINAIARTGLPEVNAMTEGFLDRE